MTYTHFIEVWRDKTGKVHTDHPDDIWALTNSIKYTTRLQGQTLFIWKIKPKNEANRKTT